ncbi:MAG TPA: T9SS type A sorting domain-containing protein [Candidatus Eisenbacteria bacterium]|nr:T9SS type A sorting domain-containing protein [Candidatus Eisenbacteria bacterium]
MIAATPLFRTIVLRSLVGAVGILVAAEAAALPPGRAWAPTTWLLDAYPDVAALGSARMETTDEGTPFFIIGTKFVGTSTSTWNIFSWQDSQWVSKVASGIPSFSIPENALSLTPQRHLVWLSPPDPFSLARMVVSEYSAEGFGAPDTAMLTLTQATQRSGAAAGRRRWVVRSQQRYPFSFPVDTRFIIRTVYSDTFGVWHELPEIGEDEDHCTMAPLSDEAAIVVYAGESGLGWAVASGDHWAQQGNLDPRPLRALHPRFAFRRSGGLWLMWSDRQWVHMSEYVNGQWSRGDSIQAVHPPGQTFIPAWNDVTHDGAERPVLAWIDVGFGTTFRDVGCVAFPTDTGWSPGEEIPGSDLIFLSPYICRDLNGDVWASWRVRGAEKNRWTHTYVKATTSPPSVSGAGPARSVTWTLSEPAPETWWAVLRARNDGPFEQVARVQAGPTLAMTWNDASPPAGVLRYRIRRESVDARYRWESEEAFWPPKAGRALTLARPAGSAPQAGELELAGAEAGALEIRVFDIQGRVVASHEAKAGGSGRDTIRLDFGARGSSLPNGIYFATVKDASGRTTNPIKVVILR